MFKCHASIKISTPPPTYTPLLENNILPDLCYTLGEAVGLLLKYATLLVARQTVSSWGPPPAGGCLMKGLVHRCSFAFLKPSIIVIG
jgi:hypothetical protein